MTSNIIPDDHHALIAAVDLEIDRHRTVMAEQHARITTLDVEQADSDTILIAPLIATEALSPCVRWASRTFSPMPDFIVCLVLTR